MWVAGRRSKYLLLAGVVAVLALTGPLAGKVSDVEDNGPTSMLPRGAQSTLVEEELPRFATDGVLPVVVVVERASGLTPADRAWVQTLRNRLVTLAAEEPVVRVASDGAAATVTYGIDTAREDWPDRIDETRALAAAGPGGLVSHVTGTAAVAYDGFAVFDGIDGKLLAGSIVVVTIVLLLTYRSPMLWLLPLVSIGAATVLSQAVIYLLAEHADMPVNGQSAGILPILVFGVGTDYALLLVARYREELASAGDRHAAMAVALPPDDPSGAGQRLHRRTRPRLPDARRPQLDQEPRRRRGGRDRLHRPHAADRAACLAPAVRKVGVLARRAEAGRGR